MYELTPGAPRLPIETPGRNRRNTKKGKDTQHEHVTIFTCNAGLAVELKETEYHLPKAKGTLEKSSRKENERKEITWSFYPLFHVKSYLTSMYCIYLFMSTRHPMSWRTIRIFPPSCAPYQLGNPNSSRSCGQPCRDAVEIPMTMAPCTRATNLHLLLWIRIVVLLKPEVERAKDWSRIPSD